MIQKPADKTFKISENKGMSNLILKNTQFEHAKITINILYHLFTCTNARAHAHTHIHTRHR